MRLYIAVLDDVPDYIVPTLVAHTMINAHIRFAENRMWQHWLVESFRKCVVRVNQKEFDKIAALPEVYLGFEKTTLGGKSSCAIVVPCDDSVLPKVLKFAKLWKPKETPHVGTTSNESGSSD